MPATRNFYRDLPPLAGFAEAVDITRHQALPADWWIVVADIVDSTGAIEAGNYKQVNTVGVAGIAAVLNVDRNIELPFLFGGDGATFAIPDELLDGVKSALRGAQALARRSFGLNLRVGFVHIGELQAKGHRVHLAKIKLSEQVTQASFSGNGWSEAERRIKANETQGALQLAENDGPAEASFEGFECRWQAVPQFNGHKLSLLVSAQSEDSERNFTCYRSVEQRIKSIYGEVGEYHPLRASQLQLALTPGELQAEWRVRNQNASWSQRLAYLAKMLLQNLAGRYLFKRQLNTGEVRWSHYREELVDNTDFRKFDGVLRMVIDGSDTQAAELESFLETEYRAGRLVYGTHKSDSALVTCLVQSYNGNHLHFVDGSDGGYALAAKQLKQRLLALKNAG